MTRIYKKLSNKTKKRWRKISKAHKGKTWDELYGKEKADELRKRQSIRFTGRKLTKEHKKKISKGNKGNKKLIRSLKKYFREVGVSKETRKKLSKALKGKNNPFYGKKHSKEMIEKIKKTMLSSGVYKRTSKRMKKHNPMYNKESVEKMRKKQIQNWKTKKYKRNVLISQAKRPNNKEQILIHLINKNNLLLNYVGNRKVWFTGLDNTRYNPDFIYKPKRIILEFFGNYWHNFPERIEKDKERIKVFKKKGYRVLIVWERELNNLNKVKNKVEKFVFKEV